MTTRKKQDTQNAPNREQLLNMAINSAKKGQKKGARMMLQKVLTEDKRNERAMLWMAKLASNDKDKRKWLDRILDVNPDNQTAIEAIEKMEYEAAADRNKALYQIVLVVGVIVILVGSGAIVLFAAISASNI